MERSFPGDATRVADTPVRSTDMSGRRPVRLWDLILTVLAGGVLPFVLAFAGGLIIGVTGKQSGITPADLQHFVAGLSSNFVAVQVFTAIIYIAMFIVMWFIARRRGPATVSGYFARVRPRTLVLAAVSGLMLACLVLFAIVWLGQHTTVTFHTTKSEEVLLEARTPLQLALSLGVIAIIAPFVEELYFRGLMLAWLRRWLWLPLAALVDAALFALVHGRYLNHSGTEGWVLTVMVGLVGLLNVIWFARTRSLWPPFMTHAFYNGTLVTLAYLGSSAG